MNQPLKIKNCVSLEDFFNEYTILLESYQLEQQHQIYSLSNHQKQYSVYFTNMNLAKTLLEQSIEKNTNKHFYLEKTFFEPFCGLGVFVIMYLEHVFTYVPPHIWKKDEIKSLINTIDINDINKKSVELTKIIIETYITLKTSYDVEFKNGSSLDYFLNTPQLKYDFIFTNPPFKSIKATSKELENEKFNEFKKYCHTIVKIAKEKMCSITPTNFFSLSMDYLLKINLNDNGIIGLIISSSFLTNYTLSPLRKLYRKHTFNPITIIKENSKEFKDISQELCMFSVIKNNILNDSFLIDGINVDTHTLSVFNNDIIKMCSHLENSILKKISMFPKLSNHKISVLKGELDISIHKHYYQKEKTVFPLVFGRNIKEWSYTYSNDYRFQP